MILRHFEHCPLTHNTTHQKQLKSGESRLPSRRVIAARVGIVVAASLLFYTNSFINSKKASEHEKDAERYENKLIAEYLINSQTLRQMNGTIDIGDRELYYEGTAIGNTLSLPVGATLSNPKLLTADETQLYPVACPDTSFSDAGRVMLSSATPAQLCWIPAYPADQDANRLVQQEGPMIDAGPAEIVIIDSGK